MRPEARINDLVMAKGSAKLVAREIVAAEASILDLLSGGSLASSAISSSASLPALSAGSTCAWPRTAMPARRAKPRNSRHRLRSSARHLIGQIRVGFDLLLRCAAEQVLARRRHDVFAHGCDPHAAAGQGFCARSGTTELSGPATKRISASLGRTSPVTRHFRSLRCTSGASGLADLEFEPLPYVLPYLMFAALHGSRRAFGPPRTSERGRP